MCSLREQLRVTTLRGFGVYARFELPSAHRTSQRPRIIEHSAAVTIPRVPAADLDRSAHASPRLLHEDVTQPYFTGVTL